MKKVINQIIYTIIAFVVIIVFWLFLSMIKDSPAVPQVNKIAIAFFNAFKDKKFIENLLSTLKIVGIGISLGVVVGTFLAVVCEILVRTGRVIDNVVNILRGIPGVAMFPLILVLFGIKDMSRIFIIFWTAMPPIFINTLYGLKNVDKSVVEAASLECGRLATLFKIKFPISLPSMLNGVKIGIGTGFISVVTAEMLGASKGIGFMILWNTNSFKYDSVYGYIIIVALLGLLFNVCLNLIIKLVERKVV